MTASFVPQNYVAPTSGGGGNFTKLQDGENRLRILSEKPLIGWVYWNTANKPVRSLEHPGQPADMRLGSDNKPEKVKEFWAVAVWNYATTSVELWEFTQAQIRDAIIGLANDAEWGHPSEYGIKISKSGKGLDTKYTVTPGKAQALPADIQAIVDATPVNLSAIITGGNPFEAPKGTATPAQKQVADSDLPF